MLGSPLVGTKPNSCRDSVKKHTRWHGNFPGNQDGLRQGFDEWKRHSAAMVSSMAWQFQYHPESSIRSDTTTTKGYLRQRDDSVPLVPLPTGLVHDRDSVEWRFPVLVDLSVATFHNWDYLCFLHHPALAPLWELSTYHWNTARFAVAAWLSLVSPGDQTKTRCFEWCNWFDPAAGHSILSPLCLTQ